MRVTILGLFLFLSFSGSNTSTTTEHMVARGDVCLFHTGSCGFVGSIYFTLTCSSVISEPFVWLQTMVSPPGCWYVSLVNDSSFLIDSDPSFGAHVLWQMTLSFAGWPQTYTEPLYVGCNTPYGCP